MITRRIAALALGAGLMAGGAAAPAAHAATAAPPHGPRRPGPSSGPCNSLQHGEVRVIGRYPNSFIIECEYVPGLGGYYWVIYRSSCRAATAPARQARAC